MTVEEALAALLGDRQTGDLVADLVEGAQEAMRRRQRNTLHGGAVIEALREQAGLSWREIEQRTGIPRTTAQRWAETPPAAD
ncbi:MAG: helix-turn-helix domain-containing protein [Mycobacteriales bacterium]